MMTIKVSNKVSNKVLTIIAIVFLIIVVIPDIIMLFFAIYRDAKHPAQTEGIIVDYKRETIDDRGYTFPVVEYTVDGKTYKKDGDANLNGKYYKGSTIKVKYNPNNPEDFTVATVLVPYTQQIAFLLPQIVILLLILGIPQKFLAYQKRKTEEGEEIL